MTPRGLAQPAWFWRTFLIRGTVAWAAIRLAYMLVARNVLPPGSLVVVLLAGVLVHIHSRSMRERVFLANMGAGRSAALVPFLAAAALESAAFLLAGARAG